MKYSRLFLFFCVITMCSCYKQEARRPVDHSTTNFYQQLIEKNKKLNLREKKFIENLLQKDSLHQFIKSSSGFWYTYQRKDSVAVAVPKTGDQVVIEYAISDIFDKELYAKQQIVYKIDKQDFIPALQDGIKLMKQGETITFVIPSYRAFGVTGDGNKIGSNQPIKSKVTLVNIKSNNDESK